MSDFGGDPSTVTDGIANLVAKSLVALDWAETETRWYLLETTRAYALGKLADSGEAGLTARRHAEYCLALFAPFATTGFFGYEPRSMTSACIRREINNTRAALCWAFGPEQRSWP